MGDVAAAFDGEDEVVGSVFVPLFPTGGALKRVEGAVDFDGVKLAGGVVEFFFLGEVFGVEGAALGVRAPPAGDCRCGCRAWCALRDEGFPIRSLWRVDVVTALHTWRSRWSGVRRGGSIRW